MSDTKDYSKMSFDKVILLLEGKGFFLVHSQNGFCEVAKKFSPESFYEFRPPNVYPCFVRLVYEPMILEEPEVDDSWGLGWDFGRRVLREGKYSVQVWCERTFYDSLKGSHLEREAMLERHRAELSDFDKTRSNSLALKRLLRNVPATGGQS